MDKQKISKISDDLVSIRPLDVQICFPPGLEIKGASKWTTSITIYRTGYHIMKVKEWLESKQWKAVAPVEPSPDPMYNNAAGWKSRENKQDEVVLGKGYENTIKKAVNGGFYIGG